nr:hypothetical protein CR513_38984 [Ipomoea trifida]
MVERILGKGWSTKVVGKPSVRRRGRAQRSLAELNTMRASSVLGRVSDRRVDAVLVSYVAIQGSLFNIWLANAIPGPTPHNLALVTSMSACRGSSADTQELLDANLSIDGLGEHSGGVT